MNEKLQAAATYGMLGESIEEAAKEMRKPKPYTKNKFQPPANKSMKAGFGRKGGFGKGGTMRRGSARGR